MALQKSESVLRFDSEINLAFTTDEGADIEVPSVNFIEDDASETSFRRYTIDKGTYEDLGSPQEITVTIVPGNQLN